MRHSFDKMGFVFDEENRTKLQFKWEGTIILCCSFCGSLPLTGIFPSQLYLLIEGRCSPLEPISFVIVYFGYKLVLLLTSPMDLVLVAFPLFAFSFT